MKAALVGLVLFLILSDVMAEVRTPIVCPSDGSQCQIVVVIE